MGDGSALAVAGRNPFLTDVDVNPAGTRDGALHRVPPLSRIRNTSLLCAGTDADWNHGSVHPDQVADTLAGGTVRHRDCGAYRGICLGSASDVCGINAVEACARAGDPLRIAVQLATDLSTG